MVSHSLCVQMHLTLDRLKELRAYVGFGPKDEDNLRQVRELIVGDLDRITASFHNHVTRFQDLRPFFDNPPALRRLKRTLRNYILTLGKDTTRLEYAEQRLRVGLTHERIGLGLHWYLGSCPFLFESIATALAAESTVGLDTKLPELLTSLQKAITIDSVLAVEAYHHASMQRLEEVVEEHKTSQERLYRESQMDGLTQVFNKQAVMTILEAELVRCRRQHLPFTVLILDVDHFKRVNDEHGHPFGDLVLRQIADIVRTVMRPGDIVGRFGGDEIVVGLGGCSMEDATKIAERLRLKVALATFRCRGHRARATLSIGVAQLSLRAPAPALDRVIDEADQALYRAKQAGRNRTCVANIRLPAGRARF